MKMKFLAVASIYLLSGGVSPAANAAVTVSINQVGTSVIATTSGSLNLTGLTFVSGGYTLTPAITGSTAYVGTGNGGAGLDAYSGFAGPGSFGTGSLIFGTGAGTTPFGINGSSLGTPVAFVQSGYVSGTAIASTLTFANSTFAGLGINQGVYTYFSSNDKVTVTIGNSAAVPEPATWAMMVGGFGMLGSAMRRRRPAMAQA